jgi:putative transport protein
MTMIVEWIGASLRDHPELALFLALATGYLLGRVRMGSFKLGPVVGCLLAGVAVGQIGIVVPGVLGKTFFLLFLFSIGYKTGPQFFRGFGRGSLPQVALTLLFDVTGLLTVYAVATFLGFDAGTAVGLLAGGSHSSEALGIGSDAIARLAVGDEVRRALTADATVAYAVTYLVAIFAGIFVLVQAGPWLMRVDLRAECKKLEDELGMKKEEIGVVSAYKQFVMRAYKVPEKMDGKSIAEVENEFSPERVFVERVKNAQGVFDAEPDLRLHAGNLIVLSGRPRMLAGAGNQLQSYEVEEPQLLDVPAIAVDYVLERKDLVHRTLAEIVEVLERDVPTRGVYLRKVLRAGQELPLGSKVVLERGDVLTLIGAKRHVDRVAARLGPVERASYATDLVWLCLAIGIGGLLGLPAIHAGGLTIALGLPVGVLLASFVIGWLHSIRPLIGRVPEPVIWLFDSLGLNGFLAAVGISAGPNFVRGLRSTGLELVVTGVIVCAVPYLLTILAGRYIFRIHPGILLGMCAGSGTSSPGLAAVQEKAESRVPVLGYGVSYAISALVFALWGSLIVMLVDKGS